jgi:hypothetical protein
MLRSARRLAARARLEARTQFLSAAVLFFNLPLVRRPGGARSHTVATLDAGVGGVTLKRQA